MTLYFTYPLIILALFLACSRNNKNNGQEQSSTPSISQKHVQDSDTRTIAIYVTPWYNSDPLTINVGEFSQKLYSSHPEELKGIAQEIHSKIATTPIEALYVLAIRLYDVGLKDDALYWYYTAQFRKNIYSRMIEDVGGIGDPAFEYKQAQVAFNKLSGRWINGYAGGVLDTWLAIITRVSEENTQSPYIGITYPNLTFKSPPEQAVVIKEILKEYAYLQSYIRENREEIIQSRKENGIDGKY